MKKLGIALCSLFFIIAIVACQSSSNSKAEQSYSQKLYEAKLDFVGDNSGVGKLVSLLDFDDFGPYTLQLHTAKNPMA